MRMRVSPALLILPLALASAGARADRGIDSEVFQKKGNSIREIIGRCSNLRETQILKLRALLDVFIVRKVGVPGHEELALGAIPRRTAEATTLELAIPRAAVSTVVLPASGPASGQVVTPAAESVLADGSRRYHLTTTDHLEIRWPTVEAAATGVFRREADVSRVHRIPWLVECPASLTKHLTRGWNQHQHEWPGALAERDIGRLNAFRHRRDLCVQVSGSSRVRSPRARAARRGWDR